MFKQGPDFKCEISKSEIIRVHCTERQSAVFCLQKLLHFAEWQKNVSSLIIHLNFITRKLTFQYRNASDFLCIGVVNLGSYFHIMLKNIRSMEDTEKCFIIRSLNITMLGRN